MLEHFQALFGDLKGFVPVVTFPTGERKSGKEWKDWSLNDYRWFQWPVQATELVAYCQSKKKEDVYTTVGVCSDKNNKKGSIEMLNVLHCEADGARPEYFPVEPSIVNETSPGRFHLFWLLDKPTPAVKVEPLAKKVAYSQREHGADFGWATNKLMRVPGTTNTKPDYDKPKVQTTHRGLVYTLKDLKKAFGGTDVAPLTTAGITMPTKLPELNVLLQRMPSTPDIWEMYSQAPKSTPWNPNASRYKVLYKLACHLFRLKFNRDEVFVICQHSASNKYKQDGRSEAELWRDVLKAEEDVNINNIGVVFVESSVEGEVVEKQLPIEEGCVLLTEDERLKVRSNVFIDNYVRWAEEKSPMADSRYHSANAITILSTVFSQYAMGQPQFGALPLNVWFMVLGVTSRSGKTTAANLMLRMLGSIGADQDNDYELASDATQEALNITLAKRGDVSSLFHVDEAQALIGDSKGDKGYMAGMITLLTKLYDGKVPARERAVGVSTKSTPTSLVLNLLGVPGKMADNLSRDDFASGFLARFVFVLGTPKKQTRETAWLSQADKALRGKEDPDYQKLVTLMVQARMYWERKRKDNRGNKVGIWVADDAWARWNEMKYTLENEIAPKAADPEAMLPTAQRMAISVYKLACLFAMSEMTNKVKMSHMLAAMQYGEKWYDTATMMVAMVHESSWSRQVSDLVDYLGVHGKKTYSEVYRARFSNLKPREMMDLVDSGEQTGRIRITYQASKSGGQIQYLEKL